jgi:hypothetical protein
MAELGKLYGVSPATILRELIANNVPTRKRGPKKKNGTKEE